MKIVSFGGSYYFNINSHSFHVCILSRTHLIKIHSVVFSLNSRWKLVHVILITQEPRGAVDRNPLETARNSISRFVKSILSLTVTSRVIKSPWSIFASACRSSGRCAIEKSSSRKPSFTEFRVRDARATSVPPHITTAIATNAYCQQPSGRFDQYSRCHDLYIDLIIRTKRVDIREIAVTSKEKKKKWGWRIVPEISRDRRFLPSTCFSF